MPSAEPGRHRRGQLHPVHEGRRSPTPPPAGARRGPRPAPRHRRRRAPARATRSSGGRRCGEAVAAGLKESGADASAVTRYRGRRPAARAGRPGPRRAGRCARRCSGTTPAPPRRPPLLTEALGGPHAWTAPHRLRPGRLDDRREVAVAAGERTRAAAARQRPSACPTTSSPNGSRAPPPPTRATPPAPAGTPRPPGLRPRDPRAARPRRRAAARRRRDRRHPGRHAHPGRRRSLGPAVRDRRGRRARATT